jgi:hypothetical protein
MMICLISCRTVISNSCSDIVNYTFEEQDEMSKLLLRNDNDTLYKFMKNYGELREKSRICQQQGK